MAHIFGTATIESVSFNFTLKVDFYANKCSTNNKRNA